MAGNMNWYDTAKAILDDVYADGWESIANPNGKEPLFFHRAFRFAYERAQRHARREYQA